MRFWLFTAFTVGGAVVGVLAWLFLDARWDLSEEDRYAVRTITVLSCWGTGLALGLLVEIGLWIRELRRPRPIFQGPR